MYLLIILSVLVSTCVSFVTSLDACSTIANPDCRCTQSTASSPNPDITCSFQTQPPAPLFTNISSVESITVKTLDLSNNSLGDLPEDFFFGRHLNVEKLVLSGNNLAKIPDAVRKLGEVKSLDVSDNMLASMSVEVLAGISGLEELDLSGNSMHNLSLTDGENALKDGIMLNLKSLDLSGNGISSIDGAVFTRMGHLTSLDLSHNSLQEVTNTMFTQLEPSLVTLNLSHNALQHLQPLALRHLGHLRVLSLAHNSPLTNVEALQFPQHLRSLDLSHCALTIIDHCPLSSLADLSYLGLSGNHLQCTCQLYLLWQWYQNQHHTAGITDANSGESSWTCLNVFKASNGTVTAHVGTATADPHLSQVEELTQCQDTNNHCSALEHVEHHQKGSGKMEVTLDVASSSGTLMAFWTFKENGEVVVDGFRLHYMPEDASPMSSPVIPADQRSYIMRPSELEIHFMVCLDVLAYETAVIHQECRSFKDESGNIVVGILAGVVFLVPCIVAMMYVFWKDHRINKDGSYAKVDEEAVVVKDAEKEEEEEETHRCFFHVNCSAKLCTAQGDSAEKDGEESVSSASAENGTARNSSHKPPPVVDPAEGETNKTQAELNSETYVVVVVDDVTLVNSPESNIVVVVDDVTLVHSPESKDNDVQAKAEADGEENTETNKTDSDGNTTKHNPLSNGKPTKPAEETILSVPATDQGKDNPGYICGDEEKCQNSSDESTDF